MTHCFNLIEIGAMPNKPIVPAIFLTKKFGCFRLRTRGPDDVRVSRLDEPTQARDGPRVVEVGPDPAITRFGRSLV